MATTSTSAQKRIAVEYLSFGSRTAKRVTWESWEFTIVGPHLVNVTNASYGFLKDEHSYTVGVAVRDGVAVPAECDCPADIHREPDCKHKVALATIGGPTVLDAAVAFEQSPSSGKADAAPVTGADLLKSDGGRVHADDEAEEECPECAQLADLRCWQCFDNPA